MIELLAMAGWRAIKLRLKKLLRPQELVAGIIDGWTSVTDRT